MVVLLQTESLGIPESGIVLSKIFMLSEYAAIRHDGVLLAS